MRNCLRWATNLATYLTARTEASESSKTISSLVSCVLLLITTSKPELKPGFLQLGMILYFIHLLLNAQFVPPVMTRITLAGTNGNDTLIVFYRAVQSVSESHTRTRSIQPRVCFNYRRSSCQSLRQVRSFVPEHALWKNQWPSARTRPRHE